MTRRKKIPLRALTEEERTWLECISRSQSEPASHVARAKHIFHVANGSSDQVQPCSPAAKPETQSLTWVKQFNQERLNAIQPRHGGVPLPSMVWSSANKILKEARRKPDPQTDGTATWSLKTLCQALRKAPDGLPEVSEDTIRTVLLKAGFSWQEARSWCETGKVTCKRKRGKVTVIDPDAGAKKT